MKELSAQHLQSEMCSHQEQYYIQLIFPIPLSSCFCSAVPTFLLFSCISDYVCHSEGTKNVLLMSKQAHQPCIGPFPIDLFFEVFARYVIPSCFSQIHFAIVRRLLLFFHQRLTPFIHLFKIQRLGFCYLLGLILGALVIGTILECGISSHPVKHSVIRSYSRNKEQLYNVADLVDKVSQRVFQNYFEAII